MRVLVQRVTQASVSIGGQVHSSIGNGLLVLVGVEAADTAQDCAWLAGKIAALRIFDDDNGVMNLDVRQVGGDVLVVSQFTLHASTKKGNRPSYIRAANEAIAVPLYNQFVDELHNAIGKPVPTGIFGADMQINLINNGPVTIWIDSKNRE